MSETGEASEEAGEAGEVSEARRTREPRDPHEPQEPPAPLGQLAVAGWSALGRYTGTLLTLFVVQLALAAMTMFAMARVLSAAFSQYPYFDRAVDGDLAGWIYLLGNHREVFAAVGWLGFGAVLVWLLVSWFLHAGTIGVLGERPEGRAATARCFGANGASAFLSLMRLSILSLPSYLLVVMVLFLGLDAVAPRIEFALSLRQLLGWLAVGLAPALVMLHILWTISDYARTELVLRRDSHQLSVLAAYGRALSFVLRRPGTLLHTGLGWLLVGAVALVYALAAHGHPMAGEGGAVALLIVRQGVVLAQLAIRFCVHGGQVALVRQRPSPPVQPLERSRVSAP